MFAKESSASSPSREAILLLVGNKRVASEAEAVSLLNSSIELVIKAIADVESKNSSKLYINLPQKSIRWEESYIDINRIEFLFDNLSVKKIKDDEIVKIRVPVGESFFEILVPMVLKGSHYKVVQGKIVVRVDKNMYPAVGSKEDMPLFASNIRIFIDELGNIYY